MIPLKMQAVHTALQGDWQAAIILNQMLLEENPEDIDALNRLAFAKTSLGEIKEAKSIYIKVLSLDANNPIATKNLQRLSGGINQNPQNSVHLQISNVFIEEPGKTKVVLLINTADKKVLTPLRNGEQLFLLIKRMKIFVYDTQKQYIGMLPHDMGNRLIKFIEGGNVYEAYIKTVHNMCVTILIKEVKKAIKFKNQPSFISIEKSRFSLNNNCDKTHKENKLPKATNDDSYPASGELDESSSS
jgi:tetratricopeptide (TPR) repeat protein